MKKAFRIENLDCANCAAKIENAVRQIEGVHFVTVSFMMQKLTLEAQDDVFESVLEKAIKVCKKIEPDCTIVPR